MFSLKHIIILILATAFIVTLFMLTKKWSLRKKYLAFMILSIVSETVKVFTYTIINEDEMGGVLPKSDLPFHLCSIQIIFAAIYLLCKNEKIKRAIVVFMMPSGLIGAAAALLIPTNSSLTVWTITFQYNIYHAALITLALHILTDKEIKLTRKDYVTSMCFIGGLMFFSMYINSILYDGINDVNFMYVSSPPQSGLPFLTEKYGWVVYIVHYAFTIFVAISAFYVKPLIVWLKSRKTTQAAPTAAPVMAQVAATADEPETKTE